MMRHERRRFCASLGRCCGVELDRRAIGGHELLRALFEEKSARDLSIHFSIGAAKLGLLDQRVDFLRQHLFVARRKREALIERHR